MVLEHQQLRRAAAGATAAIRRCNARSASLSVLDGATLDGLIKGRMSANNGDSKAEEGRYPVLVPELTEWLPPLPGQNTRWFNFG